MCSLSPGCIFLSPSCIYVHICGLSQSEGFGTLAVLAAMMGVSELLWEVFYTRGICNNYGCFRKAVGGVWIPADNYGCFRTAVGGVWIPAVAATNTGVSELLWEVFGYPR